MRKSRAGQPILTYGQLNSVLVSLGFERRETSDFTAYREANHDAMILLPVMEPNATVIDPHLVAVSNTITGKGIAKTEELNALIFNFANGQKNRRIIAAQMRHPRHLEKVSE